MQSLTVTPQANDFGAAIEGLALSRPIGADLAQQIKDLWCRYQVVFFPNQPLTHQQLERFTQTIGPFGHNPFVQPMAEHQHILEVCREPDEEVMPFGGSWHSDWSFQLTPPSATILHAKIIPPIGGDTHYADGFRAYEHLDPALRQDIDHLTAVHSARRSYSHEGYKAGGDRKSMKILPSNTAWDTQVHPVVRTHPVTKRRALWINPVYTIALEGLTEADSSRLLKRLFDHLLQEQFLYQHQWATDMLTMWDNRSVLHCAQGGYAGYRRLMHRTTVAGDQPY